MGELDSNINTPEETMQLKKLQMYQKLVIFTLLRYKWKILLVFCLTVMLGIVCRYVQHKNSHSKHEGSVTLFYTPRPSEEVKPLSLNQVLGIFSRQQIFKQLVDELHLDEKQRARLKQSIEVKLLRDHSDMFTVTGTGKSDEEVKLLVNTFLAIAIRNYEEYRTAELRNFLESRERRMLELQQFQNTQVEKIHALHRKYGIIHPVEEMGNVKKIQGEQSAALSELNVKLDDARYRFAIAKKNYDEIPANVIKHRMRLMDYTINVRKNLREYEKAKLMFAERNPRFTEAQIAYETLRDEFENFKKRHNITNFEETMLLNIEDRISRYQQAEVILNQLELSMKSLQSEIAMIRDKEKKLQQMIPEHEHIEQLHKTAGKNVALLVEELTRVRSNIAHVPSDLTINESLVSTKSFPAFPVKILAVIIIAAVFAGGLYGVIIVTWDIAYGKFSGIEEAGFHKDFFNTVGVIPHENADFSPEQRKILNNEMFYRFILRLKETRVLFSCSLDGSFLSSVMFDEQFSKAKRNTVLVRLIQDRDEEKICGSMQKIGDFYYSDNGNAGTNYIEKNIQHDLEYLHGFSSGDGKGYGFGYGFAFFPVRSLSVLEPDEISKLYNIVNELKKHYQLIRISREKPFNASCTLVRQLHDICDATLLYIGKKQTPRSVLRKVLKLHDEEHKIYAILTGVTDVEKVISGDYIG